MTYPKIAKLSFPREKASSKKKHNKILSDISFWTERIIDNSVDSNGKWVYRLYYEHLSVDTPHKAWMNPGVKRKYEESIPVGGMQVWEVREAVLWWG